ncbi:FxLD family lanthipeptide [Nocardiopsis sp. EMB25]|uniref:FxLD family lanthipeptide n=1 Tax=Nocardiopsis sp. EMB25 TaxID=2835867 RepID=UPI00228374EF|nr:FxLD family lanthipeptide [Nocardiopsis sp. EMB25]MCY9783945.1 FxLD family lanthipeptide [Nocardiopsis sp. EMB25]
MAQESQKDTQAPASSSPFALDIRLIETSDTTPLINPTDDGCGTSCPDSCTPS